MATQRDQEDETTTKVLIQEDDWIEYEEFEKFLKAEGRRSTVEYQAFIQFHLVYKPLQKLIYDVGVVIDRLDEYKDSEKLD